MRTTVLQHWGGHQKDEGREGDKRPVLEKDCGEGEKQGRMEEFKCSQGGSTEQRVLVREHISIMRLLACTGWMMMSNSSFA